MWAPAITSLNYFILLQIKCALREVGCLRHDPLRILHVCYSCTMVAVVVAAKQAHGYAEQPQCSSAVSRWRTLRYQTQALPWNAAFPKRRSDWLYSCSKSKNICKQCNMVLICRFFSKRSIWAAFCTSPRTCIGFLYLLGSHMSACSLLESMFGYRLNWTLTTNIRVASYRYSFTFSVLASIRY